MNISNRPFTPFTLPAGIDIPKKELSPKNEPVAHAKDVVQENHVAMECCLKKMQDLQGKINFLETRKNDKDFAPGVKGICETEIKNHKSTLKDLQQELNQLQAPQKSAKSTGDAKEFTPEQQALIVRLHGLQERIRQGENAMRNQPELKASIEKSINPKKLEVEILYKKLEEEFKITKADIPPPPPSLESTPPLASKSMPNNPPTTPPSRDEISSGVKPFSERRITKESISAANIGRLIKIKFYSVVGATMTTIAKKTDDTDLKNRAKIFLAKNVSHTEYKASKVFAKRQFGENLLVSTRNIASKKTLDTQADQKAYEELTDRADVQSWEREPQPDISLAKTDGICLSTCLSIAGKLPSKGLTEHELKTIIAEYSKGASEGLVSAAQAVYEELTDASLQDKSKLASLHKCSITSQIHMQGQNPLDQLEKFHELPSGTYQTSFKTGEKDGAHALLYIKLENKEGYLFDPNYGLIKCDEDKKLHAKTYLKLLNMYEPPYNEDGTPFKGSSLEANYGITILEVKPNPKS